MERNTYFIIGAGISGIAAAKLLMQTKTPEEKIVLYDANASADRDAILHKLGESYEGDVICGALPDFLYETTKQVICSPGVPIDMEPITGFVARGISVIGEIELAFRYAKGKIIGITGTNGKTTTTALTGRILQEKYEHVFIVGNIGIPFTQMVLETTDDSVTVIELSSFQLETVQTFCADCAAILNITPDHLNRHHTMEAYTQAKMNITRGQTTKQVCILNYNDLRLREQAANVKASILWFSSTQHVKPGMYLDGDGLYYEDDKTKYLVCKIDQMNLIGRHNYENCMAAICSALTCGVSLDGIRKALASFRAVEHRIEYVATKNGVKYYNDSKGTNPDASIQAVRAMNAPTYLIGGGYDKGSTYEEWVQAFDGKIKQLLLMGQTAQKIAACADKLGFHEYRFVESMEEAVTFASEHALPGENVLLSPCCASWGMFQNYEERGRIFKELVHALR